MSVECATAWWSETVERIDGPGQNEAPTVCAMPACDGWEPRPQSFGPFQLLRCLGAGRMGVVWLAVDTILGRNVALKFPRHSVGENALMNEAFCLANLHHPGIARAFGWHSDGETSCLAMQFVEGVPLNLLLSDRAVLPVDVAVRWTRQLAEAIGHCHEQGWLHRDLKPANVLMTPAGRPVLVDFGLASPLGERPLTDGRLTRAGSPGYMPPELLTGCPDALSPALDVFSLGVIFFELLTGRSPFGETVSAFVNRVLRDQTPRPSSLRPGLSRQIDLVCARLLARDRDERFATMHQAHAALTTLSRRLARE